MDTAKKMLIIKIVVIAVIALIAFTIVLMVIKLSAANALLLPVEQQLNLLEAGQVESAFDLTAQNFKETETLEKFKNFVEMNPLLTSKTNRVFNERRVEGNYGFVKGAIATETGARLFIVYDLIKEGGQWKIIHLKADSNPL